MPKRQPIAPLTGTGPFDRREREALERIARLLDDANREYERAFFGDRHRNLLESGYTLFNRLRAGREQTARLRANYAQRPPLLLADTKPMVEVAAPVAEGTRVLVEHDRLPAESRSAVMEVSAGRGGTGWRIKHDFRPMGAVVIEGINVLGETLEMPVHPETIRVNVKGDPDAVS